MCDCGIFNSVIGLFLAQEVFMKKILVVGFLLMHSGSSLLVGMASVRNAAEAADNEVLFDEMGTALPKNLVVEVASYMGKFSLLPRGEFNVFSSIAAFGNFQQFFKITAKIHNFDAPAGSCRAIEYELLQQDGEGVVSSYAGRLSEGILDARAASMTLIDDVRHPRVIVWTLRNSVLSAHQIYKGRGVAVEGGCPVIWKKHSHGGLALTSQDVVEGVARAREVRRVELVGYGPLSSY